MNTTAILEVIAEKEKQYSFNDYIKNYIDEEKLATIEDTDELDEYLQELDEDGNITDTEVIYYHRAMDYLREEDASLNESIELAVDMGFELKSINSELLASLLKSQRNKEDYQEFIKEVIEELK